jgi:serine protease Do
MGNPFGLSQTVTAGIVSATGRANVGIAEYEDFIQTDAAINPGNSGGPLVSLDGRVVGINTAIATRSGGYQGVGFAIPVNMVKQVMDAIVEDGKVVRGWLGASIQNLTQDLADSFGFEGTDGVLIGDVVSDGPGDKGGLEAGDIVVRFAGKSVDDMNQLRNRVAATKPGKKVEVEVFRDGKRKKLDIEIGELESQAFFARGLAGPEDLGMQLQNITPDLAARLRLQADEQGVVVTQVEPASVAEKSGIRPGDIVIAVGSDRVTSLSEFREALAKHDLEKGVRLRLKTEGMQRFVFLKR